MLGVTLFGPALLVAMLCALERQSRVCTPARPGSAFRTPALRAIETKAAPKVDHISTQTRFEGAAVVTGLVSGTSFMENLRSCEMLGISGHGFFEAWEYFGYGKSCAF